MELPYMNERAVVTRKCIIRVFYVSDVIFLSGFIFHTAGLIENIRRYYEFYSYSCPFVRQPQLLR